MGKEKGGETEEKRFGTAAQGKIKEALWSDSFRRKGAKTFVKWTDNARSQ